MSAHEFVTPEQFAEQCGASPRKIRSIAREIGACRIIGNHMFLTPKDVDAILEASRPCPLPSTAVATSGTTAVQLPAEGYEALLARLSKKRLKESQRKKKPPHGKVILMARQQS